MHHLLSCYLIMLIFTIHTFFFNGKTFLLIALPDDLSKISAKQKLFLCGPHKIAPLNGHTSLTL